MLWIVPLLLVTVAIGPQTAAPDIEVVVYFDRDAARMNSTALDNIDSMAFMLRSSSGPLRVEGHTSTLGDAAANVALAQRRATVVRDALIARGVASRQIRTEALGEAVPARPTADGVYEPLNDRVVIRMPRPPAGGSGAP